MAKRANRSSRRIGVQEEVLISRSAFCTMVGVSERQLAVWEHEDLLSPVQVLESGSRIQLLYDNSALERARIIRTLEQELEVNLPGIGIILQLLDRLTH